MWVAQVGGGGGCSGGGFSGGRGARGQTLGGGGHFCNLSLGFETD